MQKQMLGEGRNYKDFQLSLLFQSSVSIVEL